MNAAIQSILTFHLEYILDRNCKAVNYAGNVSIEMATWKLTTLLISIQLCLRNFNCERSNSVYFNFSFRIHTGEKPYTYWREMYSCELCGKCFNTNGNMTAHRLTHLNTILLQKFQLWSQQFRCILKLFSSVYLCTIVHSICSIFVILIKHYWIFSIIHHRPN